VVLPSGRASTIRRIVTLDGDLEVATAPMSVTIVLDDELDVSRGDILVRTEATTAAAPFAGTCFRSEMVWMDERPLDPARVYLLKHSTRMVTAEISCALTMNEIGEAIVKTSQPIIFDRYGDNRATGSFIVIDPVSNFTAGAGMILDPAPHQRRGHGRAGAAERLAILARAASSDAEAAERVRHALQEILI
jgi:sulfate adenylyltransferase subunit 1 (EFTu-like GTPase family)